MHDETLLHPLVTVVVPAYNAEAHIGATLRSILAQTYPCFEVLVVDDHSSDATRAAVAAVISADSRVRLVPLERNFGGPAGPRNVGVQQARGQWIAFLDADDIWHPEKLRLQLDVLQRTGALFCSSKMVNFANESELDFRPIDGVEISKISFLSQLVKFRTPTSSVVLATDLARRHPFNEAPLYRAREDLDCWLHCHEEIGTSVKIQHPLIGYRISPQQLSGSKLKMMRRHHHVLKKYTFRSGRQLGFAAPLFTFTHFAISFYYRTLLKEL